MKKLLVVLNDLEGSGKSSVARALCHYLQEKEVKHTLVVSDERDIEAGYAGEFWDIEDEVEIGQIIGTLDRSDAVVVDIASGAARNWGEFCESAELENLLAELDVEMTIVIPEHLSERCHEEIVDVAEIFSDQADYVIAHLPMEPKGRVVEKWKGGYAAKAVNYLGALHVTLPEIGGDLQTALDSSDVALSEALARIDKLPRFLEVQVTEWREQAAGACDQAVDYLIPESADGLVGSY